MLCAVFVLTPACNACMCASAYHAHRLPFDQVKTLFKGSPAPTAAPSPPLELLPTLSIRELKEQLSARRVDCSVAVEKDDLVCLLRKAIEA